MKTIFFSGITNPMSDNEMKLTRGGEPLGLEVDPEASFATDADATTNLCDPVYKRTSCKTIKDCTGSQICISSGSQKCCY